VQVRILLPVESDVPAARYAMHYLFDWMLDHGIELYGWGQSILHSKTAVIDGRWCTVGTYNLDHRSWAYNLEINVAVDDTSAAQRLEARMHADLAASRRIDPHDWDFRPLGDRLLEILFYRLRRLL
jgi:cardiolipin synthase